MKPACLSKVKVCYNPNRLLNALPNMKILSKLLAFFFVFGLLPVFLASASTLSWPASSIGTDIDANLTAEISPFEPSGAFWNSYLNKLFVVGDNGYVASMNADGSSVTTWRPGFDLEGITFVDESSSNAYLLNENGSIVNYDLNEKRFVQMWDISSWVLEKDGLAGGEAIAYMPISGTNYFLVGWQYDGTIFVFDLTNATPEKVGSFKSGKGRADLADMYYEDGLLYAIYDSENVLEVMTVTRDGSTFTPTLLHEYLLAGNDQEGFTLMPSVEATRTAFIGQDSEGIIAYTGFPNFSYVAPNPEPESDPVPVDPDNDLDGVLESLDCNDDNALYNTISTWYLDSDSDGLGSLLNSQSACEQPIGYVSNSVDAYDNIPNAGVEIPADKIDNNFNGTIDEVNIGYNHPYYSTFDPKTNRRRQIWSMWGSHHGDYGVRYGDTSIFRFSAFDIRTKYLTTVYPILTTGYAVVVYGDNVALVNAYKGENVVTTTFTALSMVSVDEIKAYLEDLLGL